MTEITKQINEYLTVRTFDSSTDEKSFKNDRGEIVTYKPKAKVMLYSGKNRIEIKAGELLDLVAELPKDKDFIRELRLRSGRAL